MNLNPLSTEIVNKLRLPEDQRGLLRIWIWLDRLMVVSLAVGGAIIMGWMLR